MPGKLITIDGPDGTGKKTQTHLVLQKLKELGLDTVMTDFPQYGEKSAGPVENYLNGKYGSLPENVSPFVASIFFAIDRYDASFKMKELLSQNKIIISNRYVTANMAHQGAKIDSPEKRREFFNWLDHLEYEIFGIPKPDLNILLVLPANISQQLVDKKGYRDYLNAHKRDIHEASLDHLQKARQVYLEIDSNFPNFTAIDCTQEGKLLPPEDITQLILEKIKKII